VHTEELGLQLDCTMTGKTVFCLRRCRELPYNHIQFTLRWG